MTGKLGDNNGETILRGFDQDVEVQEEEEGEEGNGEKWVAAEEARMEGGVVEEAIGGGEGAIGKGGGEESSVEGNWDKGTGARKCEEEEKGGEEEGEDDEVEGHAIPDQWRCESESTISGE